MTMHFKYYLTFIFVLPIFEINNDLILPLLLIFYQYQPTEQLPFTFIYWALIYGRTIVKFNSIPGNAEILLLLKGKLTMESEVIAFVIEGRRYRFQTTFRNQSKTIKEIKIYIHFTI